MGGGEEGGVDEREGGYMGGGELGVWGGVEGVWESGYGWWWWEFFGMGLWIMGRGGWMIEKRLGGKGGVVNEGVLDGVEEVGGVVIVGWVRRDRGSNGGVSY